MARTRTYHHFCPVARSLEVIGEKWSLLIVRDLLRGPQRFTDLLRYLGGITPKWLTLRLRDLEQAGIVERDHTEGRREVWYRLTAKGEELAPVITALALWGLDHAMRPPLAGEPVHPERAMQTTVLYRNKRRIRLPGPAAWAVRFAGELPYTLRYNGERWSWERGEPEHPDIVIETTTAAFVNFIIADRDERPRYADALTVTGDPEQVAAFFASYGIEDAARAAV
jgi:DNA-binding HxlR family transcriptional regulator